MQCNLMALAVRRSASRFGFGQVSTGSLLHMRTKLQTAIYRLLIKILKSPLELRFSTIGYTRWMVVAWE